MNLYQLLQNVLALLCSLIIIVIVIVVVIIINPCRPMGFTRRMFVEWLEFKCLCVHILFYFTLYLHNYTP